MWFKILNPFAGSHSITNTGGSSLFKQSTAVEFPLASSSSRQVIHSQQFQVVKMTEDGGKTLMKYKLQRFLKQ